MLREKIKTQTYSFSDYHLAFRLPRLYGAIMPYIHHMLDSLGFSLFLLLSGRSQLFKSLGVGLAACVSVNLWENCFLLKK